MKRKKNFIFWWWTSMESRKTENFLTTSGDLFRRIIWYICTKIQDVANLRVFSLIFFHVWFWSRRSLNFETLCIWFALTQFSILMFMFSAAESLMLIFLGNLFKNIWGFKYLQNGLWIRVLKKIFFSEQLINRIML